MAGVRNAQAVDRRAEAESDGGAVGQGAGLHLVAGLGWSGYRAELITYDAVRMSLGAGWDLPLTGSWVVGNRIMLDAASFAERMAARGVETRPFFLGMHEQPVLRQRGLFTGERYPVSETLSRQGLYLPSGPGLEPAQLDHIATAVKEALE